MECFIMNVDLGTITQAYDIDDLDENTNEEGSEDYYE